MSLEDIETDESKSPFKMPSFIGLKVLTDALKPVAVLMSLLPPFEVKEIKRKNLKTGLTEDWVVIYIKKPEKASA